jgi:hypothetical protein
MNVVQGLLDELAERTRERDEARKIADGYRAHAHAAVKCLPGSCGPKEPSPFPWEESSDA